jgi:hypothetical protein
VGQNKIDVLGEDVLGRTIVFHQFIIGSQDVTVDAGTTVTSISTTALATPEATQNSALVMFIVAILAVVVLRKRAKPSGG